MVVSQNQFVLLHQALVFIDLDFKLLSEFFYQVVSIYNCVLQLLNFFSLLSTLNGEYLDFLTFLLDCNSELTDLVVHSVELRLQHADSLLVLLELPQGGSLRRFQVVNFVLMLLLDVVLEIVFLLVQTGLHIVVVLVDFLFFLSIVVG